MSMYLNTAQRVHQPGRNRARARGTEQEQIGSQRRILPSDTGLCIACEGSSGRDWPGRNFFGAALCSAFSLERKARVGWWDVSLLVRWAIQPAPSGSRSLLDIFVSHGRLRANFLVFLPHSLTNTPRTPPTSLPSTTTAQTRHNGPHQRQRRQGRDFPVRPTPRHHHHHHHGPLVGLYKNMHMHIL